jgi:cation diffusion facilitator CzcD-associated flavoprotein CzcO
MSSAGTEVAVIGAGPYGMAIAAHLRRRGLGVRIFGSPMRFWLRMPATINLKSFAFATNVFVPQRGFTYCEYCRDHGLEDFEPCSMASFAEYGLWVQRTLLPDVEQVDVTTLRTEAAGGFELALEGGERVRARRVVVAVGLPYFAHIPEPLAGLPPSLASHSSEHTEFSRFAGMDVAVLGAGASALETAVLLLEAGARPVLLVRGDGIVFHTRFEGNRSLLERLRNPNSVIGTGRKSWAMATFPTLMHYVPEARRVRFTRSYLGPAGPWWLTDRFEGKVPVRLRCRVTKAEARGGGGSGNSGRVALDVLESGGQTSMLEVDHVIAGTGFEADVDRIPFIAPELASRVRRVVRAPALSRHFESSVPGLYFAGTAAAFSFGPLFRFVAGAAHAAPTIARHAASELGRRFRIDAAPLRG